MKKRALSLMMAVSLCFSLLCSVSVTVRAEEELQNIAPTGTAYSLANFGGYSPDLVNDTSRSSMWIGDGALPNYVGVAFSEKKQVRSLKVVFEERSDTSQLVQFTASYKNADGEFVDFWNGQNYNPDNPENAYIAAFSACFRPCAR